MGANQKILVVCEDPDRARRIVEILSGQNLDTRHVKTGSEAMQAYRSWPADLVISDYQPSDMQELQLVERIRSQNHHARFVLIIAHGQESEFRQVAPNRVVSFLRENFNDKELMQYVQHVLGAADDFYNRRRFSRHTMSIDTHCILINPFNNTESHPIAGLIRDVSRSGLSMLVRQVIPVPSMLKLVIALTQTRQSITMLAKSLSCTLTQIPNVHRLGAKFVGLLPPEMEDAIAQWDIEHPDAKTTDIFTGKSFRKAIEEWLKAHPEHLSEGSGDHESNLPRLADEVCALPAEGES
jgi:CheY-like chemotaxis protein